MAFTIDTRDTRCPERSEGKTPRALAPSPQCWRWQERWGAYGLRAGQDGRMQRPARVGGQARGHVHRQLGKAAMATGAGGRRSINRASRARVWSGRLGSTGLGKERTKSDPGFLPQTRASTGLTRRGTMRRCRGARPPCRGQGGGRQRGRSLRTPSKFNPRWGHMFSHGCDQSGRSTSGRGVPGETGRRGELEANCWGRQATCWVWMLSMCCVSHAWCENVCLG